MKEVLVHCSRPNELLEFKNDTEDGKAVYYELDENLNRKESTVIHNKCFVNRKEVHFRENQEIDDELATLYELEAQIFNEIVDSDLSPIEKIRKFEQLTNG